MFHVQLSALPPRSLSSPPLRLLGVATLGAVLGEPPHALIATNHSYAQNSGYFPVEISMIL